VSKTNRRRVRSKYRLTKWITLSKTVSLCSFENLVKFGTGLITDTASSAWITFVGVNVLLNERSDVGMMPVASQSSSGISGSSDADYSQCHYREKQILYYTLTHVLLRSNTSNKVFFPGIRGNGNTLKRITEIQRYFILSFDFLLVFGKRITTHSLSFFIRSMINIEMMSTNCFNVTLNTQFNYSLIILR
jgi:hypothetical protein